MYIYTGRVESEKKCLTHDTQLLSLPDCLPPINGGDAHRADGGLLKVRHIKMENNIQVFKNEQFGEIRTTIKDNEPWFVGKDVAEVWGIQEQQMLSDSM